MYDVISSVTKILKVESITTDNHIFRLHYKATTFILILFSLLITQKQYFGDPIDCFAGGKTEIDMLDTYCWIQSTFTYPNLRHGAHVGVGNPHVGLKNGKPLEVRHHSYYQWITLILWLQALMFYIPRYIWKICEGGKLKMLIEGMHLPVIDEGEFQKKKDFLVSFFRMNFNDQKMYSYKFFFCEALNFINVIAQIYITDAFVGGEFTSYGTRVLSETMNTFESRNDTLEEVFPKVTMCKFSRIGPSGTLEKIAAICVLPLNVFAEKLYIFLWFWFLIVAVITGFALIYRVATFFPGFRCQVLRAKGKIANVEDIDRINAKSDIGDWFLLIQIAKNVDENSFKKFVKDLAIDK